jgi:hypothetical protein
MPLTFPSSWLPETLILNDEDDVDVKAGASDGNDDFHDDDDLVEDDKDNNGRMGKRRNMKQGGRKIQKQRQISVGEGGIVSESSLSFQPSDTVPKNVLERLETPHLPSPILSSLIRILLRWSAILHFLLDLA